MMVGLRSAFSVLALMIFVTWVEGKIEIPLTCSDLGGDCVSMENNTCPFKVDFPGCDEDQICCNPNGLQDSSGEFSSPPQRYTLPPLVGKIIRCMPESYDGICESKCTLGRLEVGSCSRGNVCCGCQPSCSCLMSHGFCTENPASCDGKTENDWCGGNNCTCCVPDCPATPVCLSAGGRCAKSCDSNEESHPTIGCIKENNDACRCCVPKVEKKCKNTFWCRFYKGQCQEKCDRTSHYSHRTRNLCGNQGCVCCKKHSK